MAGKTRISQARSEMIGYGIKVGATHTGSATYGRTKFRASRLTLTPAWLAVRPLRPRWRPAPTMEEWERDASLLDVAPIGLIDGYAVIPLWVLRVMLDAIGGECTSTERPASWKRLAPKINFGMTEELSGLIGRYLDSGLAEPLPPQSD